MVLGMCPTLAVTVKDQMRMDRFIQFAMGAAREAIAQAGWVGFCAHLAWQVWRIDGASPVTALRLFRSNRDAGLILFAGMALNGWVAQALG